MSFLSVSFGLITHRRVHICLRVSFWYCSLPSCVTSCVCLCVCLSMLLSLCVVLSDEPKHWLCWRTDRQARLAWLWRVKGGVGWWLWGKGGRAGAASQPLPSGDPDVRPWLLLDHCLYFVIDLLKAVPFHDSCSRTHRMCGRKGRDMEEQKRHRRWHAKGKMKQKKVESWGEGERERDNGRDDVYQCEE